MIDLHTHTTSSDGQHSPESLITQAKQAGIRVLSITDHDTISGLKAAKKAAHEAGIYFVPGIEISAWLNNREIHVLGHFIDTLRPQLNSLVVHLHEERKKRMTRMVARLEQMGIICPMEEVAQFSGGDNFGRPHLARALARRGYVKNIKEAFDRLIGVGKPAYVERFRLESVQAIELIIKSGGAATLAHPLVHKITDSEIAFLKNQGLAGLEVMHPDQPLEVQVTLRRLTRELDLIPTQGSDFHGEDILPGRRLGFMENETFMDADDVARLHQRAGRWKK